MPKKTQDMTAVLQQTSIMALSLEPNPFQTEFIEKVMDGTPHFNLAILTFCEKILGDPRLQPFYGSFDLQELCVLQKQVMELAWML